MSKRADKSKYVGNPAEELLKQILDELEQWHKEWKRWTKGE